MINRTNRFVITIGDYVIECSQQLYLWFRDNVCSVVLEGERGEWGIVQLNKENGKE